VARKKKANAGKTRRPPILRPLGAHLRRLRLERKLSLEELAARSGLNYKFIGRVELAQSEPGADTLLRLARGLVVSIGEIFSTITPDRTDAPRISPSDLEALQAATASLTAIVERLASRMPPPLPSRAPRRPRR
jgi:transcriptional regulator with XRE-family HTH domain